MASNFANVGEEGMEEFSQSQQHHHHQHQHQAPSPRAMMRRSFSSASSACGHGATAGPKCVCAPATHAGSFKCRLHRVNSHGHSAPPSAPPPSAVSGTSTRTVEAL